VKEVVPARNKDKIYHRVRKAKDFVHLVTIIDISNFTGSSANAWFMLAVIALELAHGKIAGKKDNIYCTNGVHFQASALEIIVLYLYLTVGYPCIVKETSEVRFLPGGFLGVNANICVALLFYACLLSWLSRNRDKYIRYMKCQAGGDDVYILTKITRDDELKTKLWLKQNLSKYVGHIKELNSFIVEDSCDADVVEGIRFCRKRIRVREERHHYLIESEPAVPLNEVLTMLTVPRKQATQDKMMRTVATELRTFERENPEYYWITDALLVIAQQRLPLATVTKSVVQRFESDFSIRQVDNRLCTDKSVELAKQVPPVFHLDNVYYETIGQSISFLLCRGLLTLQKVSVGGRVLKVIMTDNEGKRYRSRFTRRITWRDTVIANAGVVDRLLM
jgi:hypothetical protein